MALLISSVLNGLFISLSLVSNSSRVLKMKYIYVELFVMFSVNIVCCVHFHLILGFQCLRQELEEIFSSLSDCTFFTAW